MIDRGLAHPWPQEVVDAARRFCQGTVISVPPMFYGRVADHAVWRTPVDSDVRFGDIELVTLPADIPYGIITTQTCDVAEARMPRRPWIQVAPVYQLTAARETTPPDYLVPLPGGALGEGTWFADLRIEIPVEKSILVGREPIQVFDSEDWEIRFAGLGAPPRSGGADEHINSCFYQPWQAKVSTNRNRARRVLAELHAVRLQVETGSEPSRNQYACTSSRKGGRCLKMLRSGSINGGIEPIRRLSRQIQRCCCSATGSTTAMSWTWSCTTPLYRWSGGEISAERRRFTPGGTGEGLAAMAHSSRFALPLHAQGASARPFAVTELNCDLAQLAGSMAGWPSLPPPPYPSPRRSPSSCSGWSWTATPA